MKIEVLKEYLAIARLRGFCRAARQLYTSQSSLSSHIAAMERELGFEVIDRTRQTFALTPAGTAFLECAQTVVDAYETGCSECLAQAHTPPPVRVAEIETGTSAFEAIARIREPSFEFVATGFNTPFLEALADGSVDIEITQAVNPMRRLDELDPGHTYGALPAGSAQLAIAMAADNPLAGIAELTSADLDGATVTISGLAFFEDWRKVVNHAVGPDARLSFLLKGSSNPAEIARADLGDTLHICSLESIRASYECRDDIVVRTTLDGGPLLSPCWLVFRDDGSNPRVRELAEKISAALMG